MTPYRSKGFDTMGFGQARGGGAGAAPLRSSCPEHAILFRLFHHFLRPLDWERRLLPSYSPLLIISMRAYKLNVSLIAVSDLEKYLEELMQDEQERPLPLVEMRMAAEDVYPRDIEEDKARSALLDWIHWQEGEGKQKYHYPQNLRPDVIGNVKEREIANIFIRRGSRYSRDNLSNPRGPYFLAYRRRAQALPPTSLATPALRPILLPSRTPPPAPRKVLTPPPVSAPPVEEAPAEPLTLKAFRALRQRLRAEALALAGWAEERLAGEDAPPLGLAFDACRARGVANRAVLVDAYPADRALWVIGDIHGDLAALESAARKARRESGGRPVCLICLGDYIDDGPYSPEVLLWALDRARRDPQSLCLLAGNHDEGLGEKPDGSFVSSVDPSDFTNWLNANAAEHPFARRLGRVAIRLFRSLPRALFLPDGLLIAHGGVPHTDLQERIAAPEDFDRPEMLQDFVWTRASMRAKFKRPNRITRGCEFGQQDFAAFCERASRALGRPVTRLVRGHDHLPERAAVYYENTPNPVYTINMMCCRQAREAPGEWIRTPVIARLPGGGAPPQLVPVEPPEEVIVSEYPSPSPLKTG